MSIVHLQLNSVRVFDWVKYSFWYAEFVCFGVVGGKNRCEIDK